LEDCNVENCHTTEYGCFEIEVGTEYSDSKYENNEILAEQICDQRR